MTLQQIHYALTIEKCGSMNKAAQELFMVQSALTASVKELEKEVGITIFVRGPKGVTPTPEGREFLNDIRGLEGHYNTLVHKYEGDGNYKRKFAVSTQHYSFAVNAFIKMAKQYDVNEFDFAVRETRTRDVIEDVGALRSEIGILYLSGKNEKVIRKLLDENELDFTALIKCDAYVYLSDAHPLASKKSIRFKDLEPYPCLMFEQGEDAYYFSEEILSEYEYPRTIKCNDRATMLNMMQGMNGYTLCSGIISDDINGDGYKAIPFKADKDHPNSDMQIGYITKRNNILSEPGQRYIDELKIFLSGMDELSK